jgi:hypothetical protein
MVNLGLGLILMGMVSLSLECVEVALMLFSIAILLVRFFA